MSSCGRRRPRVFPVVVGFVLGIALRSVGRCQAPVCPTVRVVPGSALPFGAEELERLVRLRARELVTCACPAVDIATPQGAPPGLVTVSCPDRRAEVAVDGRTGVEAARQVAIVLIDLATAQAASAPRPGSATPLVSTTAARPVATSRWSLRVAAGAAWGFSDGVTLEPMAGAGWSPSPRVRLGIDLGFARHSAQTPKATSVAVVDSVPLRAGVGFALGGGRLEAGAALRAYRAHAASSQLGLREGAFVAATWILSRLVLVASLRIGRRRPLAPQAGSAGRRTERPNRRVAGALAGCWPAMEPDPAMRAADRGQAHAEAGDTDEALVARAIRGDCRSFDELYERHVDTVWRWLTRLLGPDPEREDPAQQIFSEVFHRLDRFRGEARFRTFLYRIVVNAAVDQMKRRGRRLPASVLAEAADGVPDPGRTPEQTAEQRELVADAFGLLQRIKPKKRVAFLLRVVEGLSLEEIAEIVEASVPAVAQRVRHASLELRALQTRREGRSGT